MHIEHHKWYSPNLGQEMELLRYGNRGYPILVFPSSQGRYFDYANNGMVESIKAQIESGKVQLICIDSIDTQAWENYGAHPMYRGPRHEDYDRYVCQEVIPFIKNIDSRKPITTGCSMGGYHAGNFYFRHPDLFGGFISQSGVFRLKGFVGDFVDDHVYFNSPMLFLPNLHDPWYLDQYRQGYIYIAVGQGRWEDEMRHDAAHMAEILHGKGINHTVDWWGHDVDHDWPWWRVQLPVFIDKLPV